MGCIISFTESAFAIFKGISFFNPEIVSLFFIEFSLLSVIFSVFKAATLVKLLEIFSGAFKKGTTNKTRTISAAS